MGWGAHEEQEAQAQHLLAAPPHSSLDVLGGWTCSSLLIGVVGLSTLAFYGITFNLVVYLVQVCGDTNAAAANTVANLGGTLLLCSFLGAFVSDAYVGRLRAALIFEVISVLPYVLVSIAVIAISQGSATRTFLLVSLYLMAIISGSAIPNIIVLGADQLSSSEDKAKYFRVTVISVSAGQLLAVSAVTYIDNGGMWVWGFGLCTAASVAGVAVIVGGARRFSHYKASGNAFLRNIQVLVATWKKRSLPLPKDVSLLYELSGNLSAIPGHCKLQHTSTLSFLDKAAVLGSNETFSPWHLCTVTQVEEFKSLLWVLPVGIALVLVSVANAQTSTLFEEQASVMNRQVATWLAIPPASLNVFSIGSSILTGIAITADRTRLPAWCIGCKRQGQGRKATSLQLLGVALMCCIIAMVIAALVEWYRLSRAQEGLLVSVMWLMPQTILVGVGSTLMQCGGLNFLYSEVSESMRSVAGSMQFIFGGAGSFVSSILVTLVTAITTQGGEAGWIANNLDEGHLDYFYWFLASFSALSLGIYLVYARSYNYTGGAYAEDKSKGNEPGSIHDLH